MEQKIIAFPSHKCWEKDPMKDCKEQVVKSKIE